MSSRRFPIFGDSVPPMIGRTSIMRGFLSNLEAQAPAHLQVVGARYSGKTVVLHELARRLKEHSTRHKAISIWDLGHRTPANDQQFMQGMAQKMSEALELHEPDYAQHVVSDSDLYFQNMGESLEALSDDIGVLIILDGFDKALSVGQLSRNLLDQLRDLAQRPSLRLITSSRKTLRESIRHPEAQTSDFWNIFDPKHVRIGCFDLEEDMQAIRGCLSDFSFSPGSETELFNSTNGFPIFILEVLNCAAASQNGGKLTPDSINSAAAAAFDALRDSIATLWDECRSPSRELFLRLLSEKSVSRAGLAAVDVETLVERGFAQATATRVEQPSRLIASYLEGLPQENQALERLFGSRNAYVANMRLALQMRISQIPNLDADLKRYLERGADDLPASPGIFLNSVSGILERTLSLIWEKEFGGQKIPSECFAIWRANQERGVDNWLTRFPEGGQRMRLLDLMTGTQNSDRSAKYITKNTYVLANSVQGFRDFGQHPKDASITLETAFAAYMACIELAATVTMELDTRAN